MTTVQTTKESQTTDRFFLGVTLRARNGWQRYFAEPEAPASWKDEEKIRQHVQRKRDEQEQKAARTPFSGFVSSLCILDHRGNNVFTAACPEGDTHRATVGFFDFLELNSKHKVHAFSRNDPNEDVGFRWFGLGIRDVMHMLAAEAMAFNAHQGGTIRVPPGQWYYRSFTPAPFADPYELLVPSSLRNDIDLRSLCEFLNVEVPMGMGVDPAVEARVVYNLAKAGQLCPELFKER